MKKKIPVIDRLNKYIIKNDGCWDWSGHVDRSGRAKISVNRKPMNAARAMWIELFGSISNYLFVCHKCDNPKCTNPDHLFLGTAKDNVLDMVKKGRNKKPPNIWKDKTHCINGHEWTKENTRICKKGARRCKICHKLGTRSRRSRLRQQVLLCADAQP